MEICWKFTWEFCWGGKKKEKINAGWNRREYLCIGTGTASIEKLNLGLYRYQGFKIFVKALTEGHFFLDKWLPLKFRLQKRKKIFFFRKSPFLCPCYKILYGCLIFKFLLTCDLRWYKTSKWKMLSGVWCLRWVYCENWVSVYSIYVEPEWLWLYVHAHTSYSLQIALNAARQSGGHQTLAPQYIEVGFQWQPTWI